MITDGKKWHYLALKSVRTTNGCNSLLRSLSRLLRGITSNHTGDYYYLGCFYSKSIDNELKKHERLCGKHDYCHIVMPKEDRQNIKIYLEREIIKSSMYDLCRFRMFTK